MRTRRSPRNQERLWRELGGLSASQQRRELRPLVDPVAIIERAMARPGVSPRTRRQLARDLARAKVRRA